MWFPYGNCVTHPILVPVSQMGVGPQRAVVLCVATQIFKGKQICVCIQCSLVQYRLGVVLCVGMSGYRVCPATLSFQDNLVYKGTSLHAPPAAVHCRGGPPPGVAQPLPVHIQ
jgi:hypothetical protein